MRGRHSQRSPLPCQRDVSQRRRAAARWDLLGSGHPPACGYSSLLRPVPGQASIRGLQRAAAHLPLLHERPVFGGCRVAAGCSARVLWSQTASQQELARLRPNLGGAPSSFGSIWETARHQAEFGSRHFNTREKQNMIHFCGFHYLLIDICIDS